MTATPAEAALLVLSALLAGAINAVAGGGSFLTFPALVFTGTPPLIANATSTVALWPGSVGSAVGYRRELGAVRGLAARLFVVSAAGGVAGALGVIATPDEVFVAVLPFLLLLATVVFTFGEGLRARLLPRPRPGALMAAQALVAIYGGYFGGGMGLMMLALFSLLGPRDLHAMNALKTLLGVSINATALVTFVAAGKVDWARAVLMTLGAVAGGYGAAAMARTVDPRRVRVVVIVLGWVMTGLFFARTFG